MHVFVKLNILFVLLMSCLTNPYMFVSVAQLSMQFICISSIFAPSGIGYMDNGRMRPTPAIHCWLKSKLKLWKGLNTLWSKSLCRTQWTITVHSPVFVHLVDFCHISNPNSRFSVCVLMAECFPLCTSLFKTCSYSFLRLIHSCRLLVCMEKWMGSGFVFIQGKSLCSLSVAKNISGMSFHLLTVFHYLLIFETDCFVCFINITHNLTLICGKSLERVNSKSSFKHTTQSAEVHCY